MKGITEAVKLCCMPTWITYWIPQKGPRPVVRLLSLRNIVPLAWSFSLWAASCQAQEHQTAPHTTRVPLISVILDRGKCFTGTSPISAGPVMLVVKKPQLEISFSLSRSGSDNQIINNLLIESAKTRFLTVVNLNAGSYVLSSSLLPDSPCLLNIN